MTAFDKFGWRFLSVAGVFGVGYLGLPQFSPFPQRPLGPVAYTVFMTETVAPVGGRAGGSKKLVKAVRSDGSEMLAYLAPGDEKFARELHLTKQRIDAKVWDWAALKTSTPLSSRPRPDPRRKCIADFAGKRVYLQPVDFVRYEEVGGYPTAVVRFSNVTAWHGLALGCALVQQRSEFPDSISVKKLDRVVVGEPAPRYFELQEHYQEAAPSVVRARLFGVSSVGPEDAKDDEHYRELIRMNANQ